MSDEMLEGNMRVIKEKMFKTGEGPLWRAAADEVYRLRTVIENAPHTPECQTWQPEDWPWPRDCTCWKADAL